MKNKGITLIALVITIIVLIILAGVSINLTLGENGIFNKAKYAKEEVNKASERELLALVLTEALTERETNKNYNQNRFLDNLIKNKIETSTIVGDEVTVDQYTFLIDREKLKILYEIAEDYEGVECADWDDEKDEIADYEVEDGLIEKIGKLAQSGNYQIQVTGKNKDNTEETITYSVNQIVCDGNLVLDGIQSVSGATLENNVYEFGDKTNDVATSEEFAKNMVVLKVNGNLTINEGVTLTACKSDDGYGGPKGMLVYCTGTLNNAGIISMTARGAKAEGENVYLWSNLNGTFEYIPAVGAAGGKEKKAGESQLSVGSVGNNGEGRQTGGGASGSAYGGDGSPVAYSGTGSTGTSYSGGAGGGGCNINCYSTLYADNAEENGGAGGDARGYRYSSSWATRKAGGGAGNPGGKGAENGLGNVEEGTGENGTGGLLIIYSNTVNNSGKIEANGSKGGTAGTIGGGSSGGGSINIFCKQNYTNSGEIEAIGGQEDTNVAVGGNGTKSIGCISNGTYKEIVFEIELEDEEIDLVNVLNNEEIIGNNGVNAEQLKEIVIKLKNPGNLLEKKVCTSNRKIVRVSKNGKIIGANSGTATLTLKAKNVLGTELTKTINVNVVERLYLYFYGNECTSLTGGYTPVARTGRTFSATFNEDNVYINCYDSYGGGGIVTNNMFDLTDYKYLKSDGNLNAYATSDSGGRLLTISKSKTWGSGDRPTGCEAISWTGMTIGDNTLTCDISEKTGEYYIWNGFNQSRGYVYSVWLEK